MKLNTYKVASVIFGYYTSDKIRARSRKMAIYLFRINYALPESHDVWTVKGLDLE